MRPGRGKPVARLVASVVVRVGVLVAAMAAIVIVGVVVSTRAVGYLTEDLQPAAAANQDVMQDLTDMQAAVAAWSLSGAQSAQDDYQQALARLPGHEQRVREYAAGEAELDVLVSRQEQLSDAWLEQYAGPRIGAEGGPGTFDPASFRQGERLFAQVQAAHQRTAAAFDSRVRQASTDATWLFRATIALVALIGAAAWWAIGRARSRLLGELSEPLIALEAVVQRMARNPDEDVRAPLQGPREVQAVAAALNDFADTKARARAVEGRIQQELHTLDTAKDDFVSNVSHELRTPLTTISGYLEMIAEEFEDSMTPRHERMLEATRRNVTRLKALIDDLLALSKAESRDTDLEAADLGGIVRDAVTDVRITAARRGIRLDVRTPEQPVLVLADRAMLGRALLNLLTNAVKFSHDDGQVEVSVTTLQRQVLVTVTDHGIGIPATELDRLGTRFFRASNAVTNEIAGTGLGLRIVQTIVDKHAGDVRIESREGEGTTVVVRLMLHGDPAAPSPERVATPMRVVH